MRPKRKFAIVILALVLLLVALGVLGDGGGGFSVQYSGRWLGFSRGLYYVHTPNGKSRLKGRFYVVGPITAYNLDPDVTILPSPNQNAAEISQKVPVNEIVQLIQERDGGNTPSVSYTRGIDLSGSMEGAGGIGGLLARSSGYDCINTPLTVCITNNTSTDCIFWIYSDAGTNIDGAILTAGNTGVYTFSGIGGVGYTVWGTDYRARELEILNTWTPTLDHHALDLGPGDPEDYSASDSGDTFCADPDTWPRHDYYFADGNGNIVTLIDTNQTVSASYRYDPFGNITSQSGAMADANVYRFSSKELHTASGLYYYGYRFYDPILQRWVNPDPKEESGGINLYGFDANDPIDKTDHFGLASQEQIDELKKELELIQKMRELAEKMIENAENCKANPCYGVASPVAFYCNCFRNATDNCEEFATCICAQIPFDTACRARATKACGLTKTFLDTYKKIKKCCPKKEGE